MNNKLYVGNLPFSVTEDALNQVFTEFGSVQSARLITDRATGRSKGFGFVEMSEEASAKAAIDKLDGAEFEGRPLKVMVARPKEDNGGGGNRY